MLFCMVIVVLLLCIHGLLFVQAVLGHARHNISDRLTMTLYVKEDYSKESRNMKNFLDELELFEYGSIPVTYIDKEIALDRYVTTDPDLLGIL